MKVEKLREGAPSSFRHENIIKRKIFLQAAAFLDNAANVAQNQHDLL
jgi:hypothetical protein